MLIGLATIKRITSSKVSLIPANVQEKMTCHEDKCCHVKHLCSRFMQCDIETASQGI